MRALIIGIVIFFSSWSLAQEWRDSLSVARTAYKKGDYDKAIAYYESAQKKAPEGVDLSEEIGQSSYKAREFEKAERVYRQHAHQVKDKKKRADSFHNLGNSCMKKKDYSGAIEAYKESLKNDPYNNETRYNLSEAIRKMKDQQKKEDKQDQNKDQQQDQDQEQDQQDKNPQNNSDNKNQDTKNKSGEGSPDNQKKNSSGKNDPSNDQRNGSKLPNKSVERLLDDLMKAESATKRKMGGSKGQGSTPKSGKDW